MSKTPFSDVILPTNNILNLVGDNPYFVLKAEEGIDRDVLIILQVVKDLLAKFEF
jgi:hypothetical protein